jgi:EAL domain-containing protein (putative c-di-GMP-specific phosphodiesterase class I)
MAGEGGVIVRSTVELAHSLGLDVVAEGIEDQRTAVALRVLGCDLGQGFHYARPVPIDQLLRRLEPEPDPGFTATVAQDDQPEADATEAAPAPVEAA